MTTETYNSTPYSSQQIASAVERMGYLVWMKLPHELLPDPNLGIILEQNLSRSSDIREKKIQTAKEDVYSTILALQSRGIRSVRVGVSWAEGETPGGWAWISWYVKRFHEAGFDILPNINYTPYSFALARLEKEKRSAHGDLKRSALLESLHPSTNIPPEPLSALAEFTSRFLSELGHFVGDTIELWNEPELNTDWLPELDPTFECFVEMIRQASVVVHKHDKRVLLGGPAKFREEWFHTVGKLGLFEHIDACGVHGLRGTWSDKVKRPPWRDRINRVKNAIRSYTSRSIPVWITEAGFSTVDLEFKLSEEELEEIQVAIFAELMLVLAEGSAERVYWYTLNDLVHKSVRFLTTGWEDVLQYYFGDTDVLGTDKLLARLLIEGGPLRVLEYVESSHMWNKAYTIIDRGNPEDWSAEKLAHVVRTVEERAARKLHSKAA